MKSDYIECQSSGVPIFRLALSLFALVAIAAASFCLRQMYGDLIALSIPFLILFVLWTFRLEFIWAVGGQFKVVVQQNGLLVMTTRVYFKDQLICTDRRFGLNEYSFEFVKDSGEYQCEFAKLQRTGPYACRITPKEEMGAE